MKTLIIGASGQLGKVIIDNKNRNYILTYNKNKISGGIHFDITKDNLSLLVNDSIECAKKNIKKI